MPVTMRTSVIGLPFKQVSRALGFLTLHASQSLSTLVCKRRQLDGTPRGPGCKPILASKNCDMSEPGAWVAQLTAACLKHGVLPEPEDLVAATRRAAS